MHCSLTNNDMNVSQQKRGGEPSTLRRQPGAGGGGKYYHVVLRPKDRFTLFRTIPVIDTQGVLEVLGKKPTDEWETHKILVRKEIAVQNGRALSVILDSARIMLPELQGPIQQLHDDVFFAKPVEVGETEHFQKPSPRHYHAVAAGRRALRQKLRRLAMMLTH